MNTILNVIANRLPAPLKERALALGRRALAAGTGIGLVGDPVQGRSRFKVDFQSRSIDGAQLLVPRYASQRPAARAVLSGRLFEPATHWLIAETLKRRPGDLVHAGTFFGDMLPSFSMACPGRVYAFEPVLENYVLARLTVTMNELRNVILFHAGLGDDMSQARMDTGAGSGIHRGGGSSVSATGQTTTLLPIDLLQLSSLSVLELDVEGYELNALRGARDTLVRCKPIVMIEANTRECESFLSSLELGRVGKVPGLVIYASREDAEWVGPLAAEARAQLLTGRQGAGVRSGNTPTDQIGNTG